VKVDNDFLCRVLAQPMCFGSIRKGNALRGKPLLPRKRLVRLGRRWIDVPNRLAVSDRTR